MSTEKRRERETSTTLFELVSFDCSKRSERETKKHTWSRKGKLENVGKLRIHLTIIRRIWAEVAEIWSSVSFGNIWELDRSHSSAKQRMKIVRDRFTDWPSCLIDNGLSSPGDEAEFELAGRWCMTETVVPLPSQWKSTESARTWALFRGWRSFCTARRQREREACSLLFSFSLTFFDHPHL